MSRLASLLGAESALAGARFFRKDRIVGHELLAQHGSTTQRTVLAASRRSSRRFGALGRGSLVSGLDFVPRNLGVLDGVGSRSCVVTGEGQRSVAAFEHVGPRARARTSGVASSGGTEDLELGQGDSKSADPLVAALHLEGHVLPVAAVVNRRGQAELALSGKVFDGNIDKGTEVAALRLQELEHAGTQRLDLREKGPHESRACPAIAAQHVPSRTWFQSRRRT